MVTGVEIAGLALATFPIAVDGLRRMVEGVETIKFWRRYRVKLDEYACELEAGRVYYLDTLEELLMGIVDSDDELAVLIGEPGGIAWTRPEYERSLRRRLDRSYDTYLHILYRLRNALTGIRGKLAFDEFGKVLWDDYPTMYRELKRLKLTLSKNIYIEYLRQIDKANKDLRDFTHQNVYLEAVRVQRRSRHLMNDWKVIKAHAASLYRAMVLGTSLICQCGKLHLASLRLDARSRTDKEEEPSGTSHIKFRFLFLLDGARDKNSGVTGQTTQELEVASVLESDASTADQTLDQTYHRPNIAASPRIVRFASIVPQVITPGERPADLASERIVDMCNNKYPGLEPQKPIGFLVDRESQTYKHYFYRTGTFSSSDNLSGSLAQILKKFEDRSLNRIFYISRGHRLRIAAILASSVLQLDGTSWLEDEWTSDDIMFHWKPAQRAMGDDDKPKDYTPPIPNYQHPHLSWKQCPSKPGTASASASGAPGISSQMIRNRMLFALGLTLVELCFGRTLTSLHAREDKDTNETAIRLLSSVYDEMGGQYGDVVRRCLLQPFDVRELRLDNEEVQKKFFNDIVTPLAQNLRSFGGDLDA